MASALAGSYLDFLNLLLKLGPNLGAVIAIIKIAIADFQSGFAKLGELGPLLGTSPPSAPTTLSVLSVSEAEVEAEQKLLAMSRQHGVHASKLGDGTLLRGAWQFMQANPWIWQLLAGYLKVPAPVAG